MDIFYSECSEKCVSTKLIRKYKPMQKSNNFRIYKTFIKNRLECLARVSPCYYFDINYRVFIRNLNTFYVFMRCVLIN